MVDGNPQGNPPVKRKRGRPRKADILAAAPATTTTTDGSTVSTVNGVAPAAPNLVTGTPVDGAASLVAVPVLKSQPKPRKPRKKKGEVSGPVGVDMNLVGIIVTGVLDGYFDGGYLLTVRVGNSETVLRGVVFGPGLTVPVWKDNDVAPGVKVVERVENMPLPASSPGSALTAARPNPAVAFPTQTPAVPLVPAAATPLVGTPTTPSKVCTSPAGSSLGTAVLTGSSLRTAVLTGSGLRTAVLTGSSLRTVVLTGPSLRPAILTGSNSQVSRGQDSVQPYPIPVPKAAAS